MVNETHQHKIFTTPLPKIIDELEAEIAELTGKKGEDETLEAVEPGAEG